MNWLFNRNIPKNKNISLWLWIGLAALSIAAFLMLTSEVQEAAEGGPELIRTIDNFFSPYIEDLRNPRLNEIAVEFTTLGSSVIVSVFVIFCSIIMLLKRKFGLVTHLILASLGAAALTWALKSFFERPRPNALVHLVKVQGYSYPSGHSLGSATVYFTFAILLCNTFHKLPARLIVIAFSLLFIFLIGLSRVYLGVHYISDVLAGLLAGIGWAAILGAAREYLELRRSKYAF